MTTAPSANNTIVFVQAVANGFSDASGNVWSIVNGQVAVDQAPDPGTANVVQLAYVGDTIWQQTSEGVWYGKVSPADPWSVGTAIDPTIGQPAAVIDRPSPSTSGTITDAAGNAWMIAGGQVSVNGTIDPTTSGVTELAYIDGAVWQENAAGLWWSKTSPGDTWNSPFGPDGTPVNPLTGAGRTIVAGPGGFGTVNLGQIAGFSAAATPGSDGFIAPAGSGRLVSSGITLNNDDYGIGEILPGAGPLTLHLNSVIINGSDLTLREYGTGSLPGLPLENDGFVLVSASTLSVGDLGGTGTISASDGSTLRINSAVAGSGETIDLQAAQLTIGGQAPDPNPGLYFLAEIIDFNPASSVILRQTTADTETYNNGTLSLYNGTTPVAHLDIIGSDSIYATVLPGNAIELTAAGTGDALPILPAAPVAPAGLTVTDMTTGEAAGKVQGINQIGQAYTGPVAGLQDQYVTATTDNLDVSVTSPGWFIHTGAGMDAIAVSSGDNVLDGGGGSNFLTGGSGDDTFFLDDRGATGAIWSTLRNFHAGDTATVWGVTPSDFALSWLDGQGAQGAMGLTVSATPVGHTTAAGLQTAILTFAGLTSADLLSGGLSVSFGTTPDQPGLPGSAYMMITAH